MRLLSVLVPALLLGSASIPSSFAQHGDISDWRNKYECCVAKLPSVCDKATCDGWNKLADMKTANAAVAKADQEYTHAERIAQTGHGEERIGLFTAGTLPGASMSLGDFIRAHPPKPKNDLLLETQEESDAVAHLVKSRVRQRMLAANLIEAHDQSLNPYAKDLLWPQGVVYFAIDDNADHLFTKPPSSFKGDVQAEQARLRSEASLAHHVRTYKAMSEFEINTCVFFDENQGPAPDYRRVQFTIGRGGDSWANGIGTAARVVQLGHESKDRGTAAHEIGHLLGLSHTMQRSDRDDFVTYDDAACLTAFRSGTLKGCDTVKSLKTMTTICSQETLKPDEQVIATFPYKTPLGYDPKKPTDVETCAKELCAHSWTYQYAKLDVAKYPLAHGVNYDYGSIMHYPWDVCLQPKVASGGKLPQYDKLKPEHKPGHLNGPTELDFASLRAMYTCYQITVKVTGQADVTMWVNSAWTGRTIKLAIGKRHPVLFKSDRDKFAFMKNEVTYPDTSKKGNAPSLIGDDEAITVKAPHNTVVTIAAPGTVLKSDQELERVRLEEERIERENQERLAREAADKRISDAQWHSLHLQDVSAARHIWLTFVPGDNPALNVGPDANRYRLIWVVDGMTVAQIKAAYKLYWPNNVAAAKNIDDNFLYIPDTTKKMKGYSEYALLDGFEVGKSIGGARIMNDVILTLKKRVVSQS